MLKCLSPGRASRTALSTAQHGVSLIMVLLFLVAITGISVWAARRSMISEGMSRNLQDLEIARQAAESALRDAERDIKGVTNIKDINNNPGTPSCTRVGSSILPAQFNTSCTGGLCFLRDTNYNVSDWSTTTAANSEPWWPIGKGGLWNDPSSKPIRTPATTATNCAFTGGVPVGTYTGAPPILGVSTQPEYLIEYFKRAMPYGKEIATYRITARGFGRSQRTQVVLQSVFLPE